jgi:hypothetical protein
MGTPVPLDALPDHYEGATPVETISEREAALRRQTGSLSNGAAAPQIAMVDTQQPSAYSRAGGRRVDPSMLPPTPVATPPTNAAPEPSASVTDPDIQESLAQGDSGGVSTPRQSGVIARGMAQGALGTLSAAGSVMPGAGVVAWVKHQMGLPDDTIGEAGEKLLDKMGFSKAKDTGERALDITGNAIGSTLTGALAPTGGAVEAQFGPQNYRRLSGVDSSANQKVLGSVLGQELGLDANTKMTPTALNAAGKQIRSFLDVVRDPERMMFADPGDVEGHLTSLARNFTGSDGRLMEHPAIKSFLDVVDNGDFLASDLGRVSSNLGKAAGKVAGDDYQLSQGLFKAKEAAETMLKEGLTPQVQKSYEQAVERYGLFNELHDNALNADTGHVDTSKLVRYFKASDPQGYSEGTDTRALYQILRQSEGMGGNPTIPGMAGYHSRAMMIVRAAARTVPGGAQYVMQNGVKPGLRAMVNKPGFMAALGEELKNSGQYKQEDLDGEE